MDFNFIWQYSQQPVVQLWTTVLLHFLWQGCLVAALTSFLLRHTPNAHTDRRYVVTLLGLALVVIFPVATWFCLSPNAVGTHVATASLGSAADDSFESVVGDIEPSGSISRAGAIMVVSETGESDLATKLVPAHADFFMNWPLVRSLVFAVWFAAQFLLSFRLVCGGLMLWRIRCLATEVSKETLQVALRTARRMGLRKMPRVLSSGCVLDAAACGFFRSVVLIPTAWLTEMSPEMLEAVLAHEFAHIRRHDVWINLCQRLVEIVFFYHPAIWWLSQQITKEREHCCDALAIAATGCRTTLAKTLEAAARYQTDLSLSLATSLGGNQMSLLNRINHVLDRSIAQRSYRWQAGIVALCVPLVLLAASSHRKSVAQEQPIPVSSTGLGDVAESPPAVITPNRGKSEPFAFVVANSPPTELAKVSLPDYIIEPPDVLLIEGIRLVSKQPAKLGTEESVRVVVLGAPPERPIAGQFQIESGQVNLGPGYGSVKLSGLTTDEAAEAIRDHLSKKLKSPRVAVSRVRKTEQQFVTGEHLVAPDGTVNLGIYGRVYVAGKTITEARAAVEQRLGKHFDKPVVSLDVFVYNSKFFYVIHESSDLGNQVIRIPVSGNETVLDAISQLGGLGQTSSKSIWLSRPVSNGQAKDQILRVDFDAITRGAKTSTNYQLLPGDRLFISDRIPDDFKPLDTEAEAKLFNQLLRDGKNKQAIHLARKLAKARPESEVAKTLLNHALLLEEHIAAGVESDLQDAAEMIQEIRKTRMEERKIRTALRQRIKVDFDNVPLSEVIGGLAEQLGINVFLDERGLRAEGISKDHPITLSLRDELSAGSVLHLVLEQLRLEHFVQNGVLKISSESARASRVHSRTYTVEDLTGLPNPSEEDGSRKFDATALASLVTSTISPNHWNEVGGPGSVHVYGMNRLVISSSKEVHAEIAELFQQLRRVARRSSNVENIQRFPEGLQQLPSPYYEYDDIQIYPHGIESRDSDSPMKTSN